MAIYPAALWGGNVRGTFMDDPDIHEKWHDDIQAEVKAMQSEMGLNPRGAFATIAARLGTARMVVNTFTASGTWNKPAGASIVWVRLIGGGGGGGGVAATAAAQGAVGAGGGAGNYREGYYGAGTVGASVPVTVGAGGNGGAAGANAGQPGTDSVFGAASPMTAGGGLGGGGSASIASGVASAGGAGGAGSGGSVGVQGQRGSHGQVVSAGTPIIASGQGADSVWGHGGTVAATTNTSAGIAGSGYGSGGSGAINGQSQTAKAGGAGTDGLVIVVTLIA